MDHPKQLIFVVAVSLTEHAYSINSALDIAVLTLTYAIKAMGQIQGQ